MGSYYNIHTHFLPNSNDASLSIYSAYDNFEAAVSSGAYLSIGLHPWYLANAEQDFLALSRLASSTNVLAIGECGLDKVCNTDWQLQQETFIRQIELANSLSKPLIIHCVRAFEELLHIFNDYPPKVPVIIHGYNKNPIIAERLLARGYYLSFGKALFKANDGLRDAFRNLDAGRFFLETDSADISIAEVYKKAAEIRETGEEEIILQVEQNFKTVFRI